MDWYIFLTPLILLPIIFLFRLVGCTQDYAGFEVGGGDDGGDGGTLINVTFVLNIVDPIPAILPNPVYYIWPKFTIDAGEPIDYTDYTQTIPPGVANGLPKFTITSVQVAVSPGEQHICSCDVYITRRGIDEDSAKPDWTTWTTSSEQHLVGPDTVEIGDGYTGDGVIAFNLNYTPTSIPPTDYLDTDFQLTQQL